MLVNQSEFARLCGVSRQAVGKAVKDGDLLKRPNGKIDTDYGVNREYMERDRSDQSVKSVQPIKVPPPPSKTPKAENKPIPKVRPSRAKKSKPMASQGAEIPPGNDDGGENDGQLDVEYLLDPLNLSSVRKDDLGKLKLQKQISDLDLNHKIKRDELINKKLVRTVLSRKYEIDMASYLTIKDKLMPDIAAIFEINDPELIMKAGERMDEELWKILKHTKSLFNKFLIGIKSDEI